MIYIIEVEEAQEKILELIPELSTEIIPLSEALGRILAEEVYADITIPPFSKSAMDGFAVRHEDIKPITKKKPVSLEIIDTVPAGFVSSLEIGKGQAIKIMTGAPVPSGADTVIMVEDTEEKEGIVTIFKKQNKGTNIALRGEDIEEGELVVEQGIPLRAQEMGMLASVGKDKILVFRKPVISIISTGDELVDVSEIPPPGKIRNANSHSIAGLCLKYGAIPRIHPIAGDTQQAIEVEICKALKSDIIVLSGGVSVGEFDYVKNALEELGEMVMWRIAMKPGKPLAFGIIEDTPVFGLPGNPVSSMVSFEMFVRPAVLKMQGAKNLSMRELQVKLIDDYKKKNDRRHFVRARVFQKSKTLYAEQVKKYGSGILSSMVSANALIDMPKDETLVKEGTTLRAILLDPITQEQ